MDNQAYRRDIDLAEYLSELRLKQEVKTGSPDIAIQLRRYLEKRDKLQEFEESDGFYHIKSAPLSEEDVRLDN